jgi:hypothetical protein
MGDEGKMMERGIMGLYMRWRILSQIDFAHKGTGTE